MNEFLIGCNLRKDASNPHLFTWICLGKGSAQFCQLVLTSIAPNHHT